MSEENVEKRTLMFSFLIAMLWFRRALVVLAALALTWWTTGDDSWFEAPLPDRLTVLLIEAGLAAGVLVCTGILRLGSSRLPEAERAHLRDQMFHPLEAVGLSE